MILSLAAQAVWGETSGLLEVGLPLEGPLFISYKEWSLCVMFNATASTG